MQMIRVVLALVVVWLVGCVEFPPRPDHYEPIDAAEEAGQATDAGLGETTRDVGWDSALHDRGLPDTAPQDTSGPDLISDRGATEDTTVADAVVRDTTVGDTAIGDARGADSGSEDAADAAVGDAGVVDTEIADAAVEDARTGDAWTGDAAIEDSAVEAGSVEDGGGGGDAAFPPMGFTSAAFAQTADINGDGLTDLLVGHQDWPAQSGIYILLGRGSGVGRFYDGYIPMPRVPQAVEVVDLAGDALPDVVVLVTEKEPGNTPNRTFLSLYEQTALLEFSAAVDFETSNFVDADRLGFVTLANLDGDSHADLFYGYTSDVYASEASTAFPKMQYEYVTGSGTGWSYLRNGYALHNPITGFDDILLVGANRSIRYISDGWNEAIANWSTATAEHSNRNYRFNCPPFDANGDGLAESFMSDEAGLSAVDFAPASPLLMHWAGDDFSQVASIAVGKLAGQSGFQVFLADRSPKLNMLTDVYVKQTGCESLPEANSNPCLYANNATPYTYAFANFEPLFLLLGNFRNSTDLDLLVVASDGEIKCVHPTTSTLTACQD